MELRATLEFTTPCLGNERSADLDRMLRDKEGHVVFLQSWWRSSLRFAAKALGRHQHAVEEIQVDPVVVGALSTYRRFWSATESKQHEAFAAGSTIAVRFMLPNEITKDEFRALLGMAGRYAGISPYGWKQDFGRFVVLEVEPV
jgi:hypothetical protein